MREKCVLKSCGTVPAMNTSLKLCDEDLITTTKRLVAEERVKTLKIIEHLQAIYDRRLHLKRGYQSLHEFLVKELGYSDGAAHRRLSAMKLVNDLPEVKQSIAEGKLSLTTASQVQNFFQTEKKHHKNYDTAEKLELLASVAGTSRNQCERKLAEISPTYARKERTLIVPEDDELMQLMEEYRKLAMLSDGSAQSIMKAALKDAIAQLKATRKRNNVNAMPKRAKSEQTMAASPEKRSSRYIPQSEKREAWRRNDGRCAYVDSKTKRRCEAKRHLEIDHAQPIVMDGKTTAENLRLMCKAHNQLLAIAVFGAKKINAHTSATAAGRRCVAKRSKTETETEARG